MYMRVCINTSFHLTIMDVSTKLIDGTLLKRLIKGGGRGRWRKREGCGTFMLKSKGVVANFQNDAPGKNIEYR